MANADRRIAILGTVAAALLAACSPEEKDVNPPPVPGTGQNSAPVVSGTPAVTATTGIAYSFTPAASDADGDAISWSISGRPAWATFNPATGALTGMPLAGTYANIIIWASDGESTASIGPFTISVAAGAATGTAALSWSAPVEYTDGSALNPMDLTAYRIYHGTAPGSLQRVAEVDANTTTFTLGNLSQGTHYFAVTAVAGDITESQHSTIGSKTIS